MLSINQFLEQSHILEAIKRLQSSKSKTDNMQGVVHLHPPDFCIIN
jgi:hypothetical protein